MLKNVVVFASQSQLCIRWLESVVVIIIIVGPTAQGKTIQLFAHIAAGQTNRSTERTADRTTSTGTIEISLTR